MISISSIFTWGGRVTTKRMASAISSAYKGCKSFIYLIGLFLIPFKTNQAEFGFYGTRIDGGHFDSVFHQVDPHGLGQSVHGKFGGIVYIPVLIGLFACNGTDIDNMSLFPASTIPGVISLVI